jgi:hypothetical protein
MSVIAAVCAALLCAPTWAQGPAFQTPGTPSYPTPQSTRDSGQADRFTSAFNPAFSFIVDAVGDYIDFDDEAADDGFNTALRVVEFAGQAWVDPKAWAYFVAAAEEESLNLEEGAVHYVGLGGNHTLRIGRFFIDFGKQMQIHVHELRTLERPLVLRAYLGTEVKGDGLQWDDWIAVGDSTAVRWSIGAFANLFPEELEFPTAEVEQSVAERKDFGDLNFTARLTGFTDVGASGTLQLGASARMIPSYSVEDGANGLSQEELESSVYGGDLTYGWTDETGQRRVTAGIEALVSSGDTGFDVSDIDGIPGTGDETLDVLDDSVFGYYAFGDYAWNRFNSAGVQFSAAELPDASQSDVSELEVYFSHQFSEFHRMRLVAVSIQNEADDDALRFAVQYTAFVGAHGHGVNW